MYSKITEMVGNKNIDNTQILNVSFTILTNPDDLEQLSIIETLSNNSKFSSSS